MVTTSRSDHPIAEITMLPVAAGDATLIMWSDGDRRHTILIDAGLHETETVAYLQSIGVFHLDLIILSHPDLDHLGGLPAIVKSQAMSVDRIWCFDLAFLREFVRTGKIPRPQVATREVMYDYLLRSTLDQFSDILRMANGRGVQVLQVSEGYRLCLGGVLLEVLYPPQTFYDALHSPIALKRMLTRKLPSDWEGDHGERETGKARQLSYDGRPERLADMIERPRMPEEGLHLSDLQEESEYEHREMANVPDDEFGEDVEKLPWRMVGTLYNNLSIVVKVTVLGGINSPAILLPGDLSDWTTLVLRQWPNLRADILKMPHHGSKHVTCDTKAIFDAIDVPRRWILDRRFHPYWYPFLSPISLAEWRQIWKSLRSGTSVDTPKPAIYGQVKTGHRGGGRDGFFLCGFGGAFQERTGRRRT